MAMNKQRFTSNLFNILSYDAAGNIVLKDYSQTIRYNWNGTIHAFTGPLSISSIAAAVTDTDRFLVSDGGVLKYRTGAEVLSDIGAFILPSLTSGSVLFSNGTTIAQNNANFFWDAANARLGIGTNTPVDKVDINGGLVVRGDILARTTGSTFLYLRANDTTGVAGVRFARESTGAQFGKIDYDFATDRMIFRSGGNDRMYLTSVGNLLLNTTTDGGQRLQVQGTTLITGNTEISAGNLSIFTTNTPRRLNLQVANGSKAAAIGIEAGGVIHSVIGADTTGNDFLQVASRAGIAFYSGSTIGNIVTDPTNERMRLTTAGRLLLGTTTESTFLLDVNGTARVSGNTTITGNLTLSNSNPLSLTNASAYFSIGSYFFGASSSIIGANASSSDWAVRVGSGGLLIANSTNNNHLLKEGLALFTDNAANTNITGSASAVLQANSTTKGFLPPRMTNAQRTAISSPATGLFLYDTTDNEYEYYNGTAWTAIQSKLTNPVTGTGTTNFLPKWTSGSALGNSSIYDDGGNIVIGGTASSGYKFLVNGNVYIAGTTNYIDGLTIFRTAAASEIMRLTSTSNLLVGTTTDQGYRVQITSASADSQLNVWGATAPSIRLDNAASGATQRFVIGLATATNNFIQGANAGDVCMTPGTSSALVFGMWQTSSSSEVMRISTSSNVLIGKNTDSGQKLQVVGKVNLTSLPTSSTGLMAGDVWNNGGVLNIV